MSLSRCARDRRGVAAVEFVLAVPLVLLLMLVAADVVLLMRVRLRVEQAASQVALILAQYNTLNGGDFDAIFYRVAQEAAVGATLACAAGGSMVVTGFDNSSGTPSAKWRWTNAPSSGSCAATLATAESGSVIPKPAVLGTYAPPQPLSAVVVELATPWSGRVVGQTLLQFLARLYGASLTDLAASFRIRAYAVVVPRLGALPAVKTGAP